MSHTNSTPNYNLPQFVGTDKPTWLNDVNGAMSAIDTQMKANADSATSASTTATSASNAVGNLTNLQTTAKTDLVSAVNEVNTNANTASGVASGAVATANQANAKANAVEAYLDLVTFTSPEVSGNNVTFEKRAISCASNNNGTMGKVYGEIRLTTNINGDCTISFASPLRPTEAITINGGMMGFWDAGSDKWVPSGLMSFDIAVDGTVSFVIPGSANRRYRVFFMNSVIFAQNFGDTPEPEE